MQFLDFTITILFFFNHSVGLSIEISTLKTSMPSDMTIFDVCIFALIVTLTLYIRIQSMKKSTIKN